MFTASNMFTTQRRDEPAININGLSTLPATAAQALKLLSCPDCDRKQLAEIFSIDTAMTVKLCIEAGQTISYAQPDYSISGLIECFPAESLRNIVISTDITGLAEPVYMQNLSAKTDLHIFSVACACAAAMLAERLNAEIKEPAYIAGLLCKMGLLALQDTMPRSVQKMLDIAREKKMSLAEIERENINTDHNVIGRHLGEKWRFPQNLVLAVWLHDSSTEFLQRQIGHMPLTAIVHAACSIAAAAHIGLSGDFNQPRNPHKIARCMGWDESLIDEIITKLPGEIERKCAILRTEPQRAAGEYHRIIVSLAGELSERSYRLENKNQRLQAGTMHLEFIAETLQSITAYQDSGRCAEMIACGLKKYYQADDAVLCLLPAGINSYARLISAGYLDAQTIYLDRSGSRMIAELLAAAADKINCEKIISFVKDRTGAKFSPERTLFVSLINDKRHVGAIIIDSSQMPAAVIKTFDSAAAVIAWIISGITAAELNKTLSETMAGMLGAGQSQEQAHEQTQEQPQSTHKQPPQPNDIESSPSSQDALYNALGEMAGGIAHELNNPLAVISGRVQLLEQTETDENKRRILAQINRRTQEISDIITNLMQFAKPGDTEIRTVSPLLIIDSAVLATERKHGINQLEVSLSGIDNLPDIQADPRQVSQAIANILSNAVESYPSGSGPIEITGSVDTNNNTLSIAVTDHGCGMDEQCIAAAVQPFYSNKPAGRQLGMGLAHAKRLLEANHAKLTITSAVGQGTTATIAFNI